MKKIILITCFSLFIFSYFSYDNAVHGEMSNIDGMLVPEEPEQHNLENTDYEPLIDGNKEALIQKMATYKIRARVLHTKWYNENNIGKYVPVDLALGWGDMSDNILIKKLDIGQGGRFYTYTYKDSSININNIIVNSANNHIIVRDERILKKMKKIRVGQIIKITGFLVNIKDVKTNETRITSMVRTDTWAGACEIILVEDFEIEK